MRKTLLGGIAAATLLTLTGATALLLPQSHTLAAPAPAPAAVQVTIRNFAFMPATITIKPGTTVTWTNVDDDPHTATANDKSFHSPALDTDEKFSFTFTKPGDFAYFCALHPHMKGRVIVRAS